MNGIQVLLDGFSRIDELTHAALADLRGDELLARQDKDANSVAWLVWHLTRVQDAQVADLAGVEQTWNAKDWVTAFHLPYTPEATGYGQDSREVGAFSVTDQELLLGYFTDTSAATRNVLASLRDEDLDRIVDTRWDPPVTMGVRLMSIISDDIQHAGQAAFLRGILLRARTGNE